MKNTLSFALVAVSILFAGLPVYAQTTSAVQYSQSEQTVRGQSNLEKPTFRAPIQGESVFERSRPDYEPIGIRAGSFVFSPGITFSTQYNDNIFTSDDSDGGNKTGDTIFIVTPGLRVDSDWDSHSLTFRASARSGTYADNSTQDYTDALVAVNGAYDISRNFFLSGGLSSQQLHEERGSPNDLVGNQFGPTKYYLSIINAGITRDVGLIGFNIDSNVSRWDYNRAGTLNNNDRDRDDYDVSGKVNYTFMEGYKAFVKVGANTREYDNSVDLNGFRRSSTGNEYRVGTNFDLTDLLTGELYTGWAWQDYKDSRFSTIKTPVYGASLLWDVSGTTSLKASATRQIEDSVQADISAYVASAYRVSLEHELLRNILLGAALEYRSYDFRGISISRDDNFYSGEIGARYLLNRIVVLGLDYGYYTRSSNASAQDYTQNTAMGTVGLKF
jgi:hypothetical protein